MLLELKGNVKMDDSDSDSANNIMNICEFEGVVSTDAVLVMPFVVLFYGKKRGKVIERE